MHRAEGGHGLYALCRQIIANRGVIVADRELYLVQTAAWTTRPRPWVRVSRDRRQVQLGKHGDAWLAHESMSEPADAGESLEGAGRRLLATGLVG